MVVSAMPKRPNITTGRRPTISFRTTGHVRDAKSYIRSHAYPIIYPTGTPKIPAQANTHSPRTLVTASSAKRARAHLRGTYDEPTVKPNLAWFGDTQIGEELVDVREDLCISDRIDDADGDKATKLDFRERRYAFGL